jgi:hypothetical protein
MSARKCPSHPRFWLEHCPICERLIEQQEDPEPDVGGGMADRAADRYERWLTGDA